MNNLSEKEIVKEIKSLSPSAEACDGILDLYNREVKISHYLQSKLDMADAKLIEEKEKNKELKILIEQNLKYSHNLEKDLFENCSNYVISKDKIREKIKNKINCCKVEELENSYIGDKHSQYWEMFRKLLEKLEQELLEE